MAILFVAFTPIFTASAATDKLLSQKYANSLKGKLLKNVIAELGTPDNIDEVSGVILAGWQDEAFNMLIVGTGLDGETIETVMFTDAGEMDFTPVDADVVSAYDKVQYGMSYKEVVKLIGVQGQEGASSQADFGEFVTTSSIYSWVTTDLASLSLGFNDDKLVSKSLFANGEVRSDFYEGTFETNEESVEEVDKEEAPKPVKINLAQLYETLDYGISYEEAVKTIGKEGVVWSLNEEEADNYEYPPTVYAWMDEEGTVLSLVFVDNALESKSLVEHGIVQTDFNSVNLEVNDTLTENETTGQTSGNATNDNSTNNAVKKENQQKESTGNKLPNTSTDTYNYMLVSVIMLVIGSIGLFFTRKQKGYE